MTIPVKLSWIERAIETRRFHAAKLAEARRENSKWRISDTARVLKRSLGSISEDLLIASWLRTHKPQLKRFDFAKEALSFIKDKQKSIDIEDIEN